ncbi:unnamed protein product [Rhodiola kirilowii]
MGRLAGMEVPFFTTDVDWLDVSVPSDLIPQQQSSTLTDFPLSFAPPSSQSAAAGFSAFGNPPRYLVWRIHESKRNVVELVEFCADCDLPRIGLRVVFPSDLFESVYVCKEEIGSKNGDCVQLYALTVSGLAYCLLVKSFSTYKSCSIFPRDQILHINLHNYQHHGAITMVAAKTGQFLVGRDDGSVGCFQLQATTGSTFLRLWVGEPNADASVVPFAILCRSNDEIITELVNVYAFHFSMSDKINFSVDTLISSIPLEEAKLIDVKFVSNTVCILKDDGLLSHNLLSEDAQLEEAQSYSLQESVVADQLFQNAEHASDDLLSICLSVFSAKDQIVQLLSSVFLRRLLQPGVYDNVVMRRTLQDYNRHLNLAEFDSLDCDGVKKEILSLIERESASRSPLSIFYSWKAFCTRKKSVSLIRDLENVEMLIDGSCDEECMALGVTLSLDKVECEVLFDVLRCVNNISLQLGKAASVVMYEAFLDPLTTGSGDIVTGLLKVLEVSYTSSAAAVHMLELGHNVAWEKQMMDHKSFRKFSIDMLMSLRALCQKATSWSYILNAIESYMKFLVPKKITLNANGEVLSEIETCIAVQATCQIAKVMFECASDVLLFLGYLLKINGQVYMSDKDMSRIQLELLPMVQDIITEWLVIQFIATTPTQGPVVEDFSSQLSSLNIDGSLSEAAWKLQYYQWAMQIFEQYNINEGATQFARAALEQVDETLDQENVLIENESVNTIKGRLWANIFKFTLDLNQYFDAYCAIITNPDPESKYICLRRFLIVLYERGSLKILCDGQFPFVGLTDKVEQELFWKAERSETSVKFNPYKLLYAFEMHRHNWRKAATYIYKYSNRLKGEMNSRDHQWRSLVLLERLNGLSAAINALHLVDPAYAWVEPLPEQSSSYADHLPSKRSRIHVHMNSETADQIQKFGSVTNLEKLEKEYVLTSAEYLLSLSNASWTPSAFSPSVFEFVSLCNYLMGRKPLDISVNTNLYDMAFTVVLKFWRDISLKRELERVFQSLSVKCCPLEVGRSLATDNSRANGHLLTSSDDYTGFDSPDVALAAQKSDVNSQWDVLKTYIENYISYNARLPVVVAQTILQADSQIELPVWLVHMFKCGRYTEATNLLLEYIESYATIRPNDIVHRKKTSAAWFPYTTVEHLCFQLDQMIKLGRMSFSNHDDQTKSSFNRLLLLLAVLAAAATAALVAADDAAALLAIKASLSTPPPDGSLPPTSFQTLTNLDRLELQSNNLTGPFPTLNGLSNLRVVLISNNQFDFVPADCFAGLTSLQSLEIDNNPFSAWQIPDALRDSSSLQNFSANSANVTGRLPGFFGPDVFPGLVILHLAFNSLEGELPGSLSGSQIESFWVNGQRGSFDNQLGGKIDVIANMTSLKELWLHSNGFSGPLPDLSQLKLLENLSLRDNGFTGLVDLMNLGALKVVNLSNNFFQGPMPEFNSSVAVDLVADSNSFCLPKIRDCDPRVDVLLLVLKSMDYPKKFAQSWKGNDPCKDWLGLVAVIGSLQRLILAGNNFTGIIPEELTRLTSLIELDVSNNHLYGKVPVFRTNVLVKTDGNVDIGKAKGSSGSATGPSSRGAGANGTDAESRKRRSKSASIKAKASSQVQSPNTVVIHPRHSGSDNDSVKITVAGSSVTVGAVSEAGGHHPSGESRDRQMVEAGNMVISIQVLRNVTDNFSSRNILGQGGFGTVYKGELHDGTMIAVKRMESGVIAGKGISEFQSEIAVLTKVRHRHLVALLGYCLDGNERLLVYEYMPQGTLSRYLFNWAEEGLKPLEWTKRLTIALDVARGVEYLHGLAHQSFIHRDLKPSNILLGDDMRAKVADFGLVRLAPVGKGSIETRIAGTFGYLAPEYAVTGRVTTKVDVFSFGVILMEIITGRKALDERQPEESMHLVTWFRRMQLDKESFNKTAIDPALDLNDETLTSITTVAELAGHCCAREPYQRPDMGHAVNVLSSLVELWKPTEANSDDFYGIDLEMSLPQVLKKWQAYEGRGNLESSSSSLLPSLDNTQMSIPTRPYGFADSFTSADGR